MECIECGKNRMEKLILYRCLDCGSEFSCYDKSGWVSVNRPPKKEGTYLVYVPGNDFKAGVHWSIYAKDGDFMWYPFMTSDVTHWMPLPPEPESEK